MYRYRPILMMAIVSIFIRAAYSQIPEKNVLTARKTETPIHLDGIVEATWAEADSASDFNQLTPYFGQTPTLKTTVKMISNEKSLFCLIVCVQDHAKIQTNKAMHDDVEGDVVSLCLDTFQDKRTAYIFSVSATGAKADCRMVDDGRNRDYSWDGVWFSAAKIHPWGYVVEMEIPYRSIKYDEQLSEWGIDIIRWISINMEDLSWAEYLQNEGRRVSRFKRLVFEDFRPSVKTLNLEIYPVGLLKAQYECDGKYELDPNAGVDLFYNPSQQLTFQLTANPDFAQIEADPYDFNISRYESYFSERRPFFTEGNEVFMPAGRERNSGFYTPLELFYSRRIGRKLPDGSEVPILLGTKAFGRAGGTEYGAFLALTGEKEFDLEGENGIEEKAMFTSVRIKQQIFTNSSIGIMYVGKNTETNQNGVLDVDGAFRGSDWQLAYQAARSFKNGDGDFAGSLGLRISKERFLLAMRSKLIGKNFDIDEVGYVPWKGTGELTLLCGPRWFFESGSIREFAIYGGGVFNYERVDAYTDQLALIGFDMSLRKNWGYEINLVAGKSRDEGITFNTYQVSFSSWFGISPKWSFNSYGGYFKTYNFDRGYLAYYGELQSEFAWQALGILKLGTSLNIFIEENPDHGIEEITYNARPFFVLTPINNLNIHVYVDNVLLRSSENVEQIVGGFLFSYNFRPKSWIYFAINEIQDRSPEYDAGGLLLPSRLHTIDRAAVVKLKYLFYF